MHDMRDGGCDCGKGGCGSADKGGSGAGGCCGGNCGCGMGRHRGAKKLKTLFMALALLALAAWLGFKARNEAKQYDFIGIPVERNTIVVSGTGKVVGIPDVAGIDLGTTIERPTVADAQRENTRIMNTVIQTLKDSGVDSKDVQTTSYSVYPAYDWNNGKQTLRGYTVAQNVHVKVRKLDTVGDLIGKAGQIGANQIGDISFSVDDPTKLQEQARLKAIADATAKAKDIASATGVRLVRVVSFDENTAPPPRPIPFMMAKSDMAGAAAVAPTVEAGSNDITSDVNVTYEIQ